MIQNLLEISGYIGFGLILLFASIGFMFVWRAFGFATQLALVEYKYKALLKSTDESKAKLAEERIKQHEKDEEASV